MKFSDDEGEEEGDEERSESKNGPRYDQAVTHTSTGDTHPNKYLMCSYGRVPTSAGLSCGKHKMCRVLRLAETDP